MVKDVATASDHLSRIAPPDQREEAVLKRPFARGPDRPLLTGSELKPGDFYHQHGTRKYSGQCWQYLIGTTDRIALEMYEASSVKRWPYQTGQSTKITVHVTTYGTGFDAITAVHLHADAALAQEKAGCKRALLVVAQASGRQNGSVEL